MKKHYLLLTILSVLTLILNAQIPNNGFENWTTVGSYQNPDGWGTMNNSTAASGIFTATVGTPGNPGSSYLKLTTQKINNINVNGIAVSGKLDSITKTPLSGFAFDQRPQSLTGSWQHMIFGTSQGSIYAVLTKWNNGTSSKDTVAVASQTLSGMAMSWANFSINFAYQSGEYPDTCIIILKASGNNPSQDDYLWVDNLSFSGSVAAVDENASQIFDLEIFPNPVSEIINIRIGNNIDSNSVLSIYNVLGELVYSEILKPGLHQINVYDLEKGIYIINVKSSELLANKKILIN
jgi:hypothetical protein